MKLFDVAFKDMRQSYRSLTGIMFMFVVPILVTGLFYIMFGGQDEGFSLPRTQVALVNLDAGELPAAFDGGAPLPGGPGALMNPVTSMGDLLLQILQGDVFADLLAVTTMEDATAARMAVDDQDANVAVIIPATFTDALMQPQETAVIELYQDPTLTIGPAIVEGLIRQFADSFAAPKVGTSVVLAQLAASNVAVDEALAQEVITTLTGVTIAQGQRVDPLVNVVAPAGATGEADPLSEILGQIMGGMMIFFAFFTGAGTLQSLLVEEERGTLARLFTTPTPVAAILGGKVVGTLFTLVVQVTVLMLFGRLVFGIHWGDPLPVFLAAAGIVFVAAATGLLLASLVQNTRQSGVIYGGVLTITGMLGLITIFTGGVASPTIRTITLFVPQGWAVRGLQTAMDGSGVVALLPALAGVLAWSLVFGAIAYRRLARRFA